MCHAESPCIICSVILLFVFQLAGVSPLKFNPQSLHVKNGRGSLVAKIPVEGIAPRRSGTDPGKSGTLALVWYKGDGCDLTELQNSTVQFQIQQRHEEVKSLVILNTLNCDLATKIAHSHLAGISTVLFHNLATNDDPSGVVLEASDIISKDHPIPVYFIGYKYGHLILDTFATPNQFYFTFKLIKEDFFLTTDKNLLNGQQTPKPVKNTRSRKRQPGPTSATFGNMIYSETDFESFLEAQLDFPPMAAFFGGMILWILQVGTLLLLLFAASFLIISVTFGLIYYYPFKFFGRAGRLPSPDESDEEADELDENLLNRLMEMYQSLNEDSFATARVPEEKIASLLKTRLDESEASQLGVCGICEEAYQAGVQVTKLLPSCTHLFHTLCIEPWLRMASSCPLCRSIVTGKPHSDDDSERDAEYQVAE